MLKTRVKIKVGVVLHGKIESHEEWVRAKSSLIAVIYDEDSDDHSVREAFELLSAMIDRERAYAAFPDIIKTLWKTHRKVAENIVPFLPERFVNKEPVAFVA